MSEHALVGRNIFLLFKLEKFSRKVALLLQDPDKYDWKEITKISEEMEKYILEHYRDIVMEAKKEKSEYCKKCGQARPKVLKPIFGDGKDPHKHKYDKDTLLEDGKSILKYCIECGFSEVVEVEKK